VSKKRVSGVVALLVVGAFACAGVRAGEMTSAPAVVITSPTGFLNWTGIYVGANGGFGWSSPTATYAANDPAAQAGTCGGTGRGQCIPQTDYGIKGPLFGGQAGFNWQFTSIWVAGVEADYQWANFSGQGYSPFHLGNVGSTSALTTMNVDQSIKSFGTARARVGIVPAAPVLAYVTGGLAFGQVNESFNLPSVGSGGLLTSGRYSYACGAAGSSCFAGSSSKSMVGWAVGTGAEYALANNVLLKGEVLFIDLGSSQGTVTAQQTTKTGPTAASFSASLSPASVLLARGGINFKF
jgi:outer membrane immunogenic protein